MSTFSFDGRTVPFEDGQSIGAALAAQGIRTLRETRNEGTPRGLFCGIGVCYDCLVVVDGRPDERACVTPARAGAVVSTQVGQPGPARTEHGAPQDLGGTVVVTDVAVVGAGPAGMAAAVEAARGGARVVLLDAEARIGGQYWRHGPSGPGRHHHDVETFRALDAGLVAARTAGTVDHRPRHRVWRLDTDPTAPRERRVTLSAVDARDPGVERPVTVTAAAVVLATGAHDRVLPFPGWDLPGVLTAGGAQALLKEHGVVAGRRVVVAGSGPFLLPLAAGLANAGAQVAALLEAGDGRGWLRHLPGLAGHASVLGEAVTYVRDLARHRIPVRPRHAVVAAEGDGRVEAVVVARLDRTGRPVPGSEQRIACDAVAVGWGFVPRLDLAAQAGCRLGESTTVGPDAGAAVRCDVQGRTGTPGVLVAGEVLGVGGAALAVVTGRLAGAGAAAEATGRPVPPDSRLVASRRRLGAFAAGMHAAHGAPQGWTSWLDGSTTVCRCEEVSLDRLHDAVDVLGATDPRTAKLLTRCGMGWCQGRICGDAVSRIVAVRSGRPHDPIADAAASAHRPVAVPVPLSSLLADDEPSKETP